MCKGSKGGKVSKVKVSSKYQITLPKDVREAMGISAGDELQVLREGDRVALRSIPKIKQPTEVLYGSVKSKKDAVRAVRQFRSSGGRSP
jgi:AbrB family looped-hinge helix DNA binding protein